MRVDGVGGDGVEVGGGVDQMNWGTGIDAMDAQARGGARVEGG